VSGAVRLNGPAPPDGIRIQLSSSNPQVVSVVETVTIRAGQSSANFIIQTASQISGTLQVVIMARHGNVAQRAQLTVISLPPDLAADRIEFRIIQKTSRFAGAVEIRGIVKNVGGGASGTGRRRVVLYEGDNIVDQQFFANVAPGQEVSVVYPRRWDISSPSEGEFPPTYRLFVEHTNDDANLRNDQTERSGIDINRTWNTIRVNQAF
jgi:hypothetical protein